MAECTTSTNFAGKNVVVGWAAGCGDATFATLTYKPLGTINSKQLEYAAVEADNTNDLSGAVTSSIVVRTGFSLTVSGFLTADDSAVSSQNELINYYWTELNAGRQPSVWLNISGNGYPRIWHVFMNYLGGNEGFGTDDVASGDFNFNVTDTGTVTPAVNLSAPVPPV